MFPVENKVIMVLYVAFRRVLQPNLEKLRRVLIYTGIGTGSIITGEFIS